MGNRNECYVYLLVILMILQNNQSWGWLFSSKEDPKPRYNEREVFSGDRNSEFSMEVPESRKGIERAENAMKRMELKSSCWQNAYKNLFAACRESLADEDKRSRFAWDLTDCFQKDSGQSPLPRCHASYSMQKCRSELDNDTIKIFLEFYMEANTICYRLQRDAFSRHTEILVNDLKTAAEIARDKLDDIERKSETLLLDTHQIHDSLDSVDAQTKKVAAHTKNLKDHVELVLKHSEKVYQQSQEISASQLELQQSQATMRDNVDAMMENVEKSQYVVGQGIEKLKNQTIHVENEIVKVGDAMFSKMRALQDKADDIGSMAGDSLEKQKHLLDGQELALERLQFLAQFLSQALQESRGTLQKLAEVWSQQQQELLNRQEELQRTHDRLIKSSKAILEAQETFESKQANMFVILDKLFALHNAMLIESRGLKALFLYSLSIFVLYMLTSTKQTYDVRPRLYIGLCVAFMIEFAMIRCMAIDIEHHAWITRGVRSLMVILASAQLLYSIYTYRDYEVLNHQMLLKLNEKLNGTGRYEEDMWETNSDLDWSTWVDTDLKEDVNNLDDPDCILPEEIGDNSLSNALTTKKYNLRHQSYIS